MTEPQPPGSLEGDSSDSLDWVSSGERSAGQSKQNRNPANAARKIPWHEVLGVVLVPSQEDANKRVIDRRSQSVRAQ